MRKCNECKNRVLTKETVTKNGIKNIFYSCRKWTCKFEPITPVPVVKELDKNHIFYNGRQYVSLRRFLEIKAQAPKTGKWIAKESIHGLERYYECSKCGNRCLYEYVEIGFQNAKTNYCPYCGAKMESEEK